MEKNSVEYTLWNVKFAGNLFIYKSVSAMGNVTMQLVLIRHFQLPKAKMNTRTQDKELQATHFLAH